MCDKFLKTFILGETSGCAFVNRLKKQVSQDTVDT